MSEPLLRLVDVSKRFGDVTAVDGVSLDIAAGEFLTILGASGSGKTTTLRLIAGFEPPTAGQILMNGADIAPLPPYRRDVNTVFQQYALFPHLDVRENVGYGLRMRGVPPPECESRVAEALAMVRLGDLGPRKPRQLSGGQQQRVALARALVNRPQLLLLDEPLGALDLKLRRAMQLELKHLQTRLGITFVYVTHDQEEALTMSDRIALMRSGRIEQLGKPDEIYHRPRTRYVADFIGETNLLGCKVLATAAEVVTLDLNGSVLRAPVGWGASIPAGAVALLSVRPEQLVIGPRGDVGPERNRLDGVVADVVFVGAGSKVHVALGNGTRMVVNWAGDATFAPGIPVSVTWPVEVGVLLRD
ncbi:MAG TPA: ABC transporter ATP-binding protein [Gemmatimonadales bacterium]|nr:ABC transporter ATP-binding protein [Gemmatimonadales bacterium]